MRTIISGLALVFTLSLLQVRGQKPYDNQSLGWYKKYNPAEVFKPISYDHRKFSASQLAICNLFRSWMMASYTPKGAVGEVVLTANDKLTLYNQDTKAMPDRYGANAKTYIELKKNEQGKYVPQTNSNWFWSIMANGRMGSKVYSITTPEEYYFHFEHETGLSPEEEEIRKLLGFDQHPGLKKYISYYQPKDESNTLQYVVLLCKDNKLPYVQITKGEFLSQFGKAIERDYKEKTDKVNQDAGWNEATKQKVKDKQKEEYSRRMAVFQQLKDKYKNRLDEKAMISSSQPSLYLENSGGMEILEGKIPVYKYDPAKVALCKTDQPQWIVIAWDAEGVANADPAGTHLHRSVMENLNFDYIYNYFFYPEKVKGVAYKPLHEPE